MKILIHDYAGHPFQASLSRELARRGYAVVHAYFAGDRGPKGDFEVRATDAVGLKFIPIDIERDYDKASYIGRRKGDLEYGKRVGNLVFREKPDVVISGNTPTDAQEFVIRACRATNAASVVWIQDFYSVAIAAILRRKLGIFGIPIGLFYKIKERRQLRRADAIVTITSEFEPLAASWGGSVQKVTTIENWGLSDELRPVLRNNQWSRAHRLENGFNFLYSGTLALKHNPQLLIALARSVRGRGRVVVASEGVGVKSLAEAKTKEGLDNLIILPLQPIQDLGNVLGTADVAVAVIEPEAGRFSVPSKVQSYMCSGRPILLAAPQANLAAKVVAREAAGSVAEPTDVQAFLAAAEVFLSDASKRARCGQNGRAYADAAFDVRHVTDRFLTVFEQATQLARLKQERGQKRTLSNSAASILARLNARFSVHHNARSRHVVSDFDLKTGLSGSSQAR